MVQSWSAFPREQYFTNPSNSRYRKSNSDEAVYYSLSHAFEDFSWEKKSFIESTGILLQCKSQLVLSINGGSSGELFADLCEVLQWGGVLTTAIAGPLLNKHKEKKLKNYFQWVLKKLPFDADNQDYTELEKCHERHTGELLSDSGTTKIYSVIGNSCIIYDDRVAACLGRMITWHLGNAVLTEDIKFVVGIGKRNPSTPTQKFVIKSGKTTKLDHAKSNLRANWLVKSSVERLLLENASFRDVVANATKEFPNADQTWLAMRIYESAMFMAGHTV